MEDKSLYEEEEETDEDKVELNETKQGFYGKSLDNIFKRWSVVKTQLKSKGFQIGNWGDGTMALRITFPDGHNERMTVDQTMRLLEDK